MAEPPAPPGYRLRVGKKPGEPHVRKGINCQDHVDAGQFVINGKTYTIGFLSDGCSGENPKASHTEVAAKLLTRKALVESRLLLMAGVSLEKLSGPLYQRCIDFLRLIAQATYPGLSSEPDYVQFIGDYMMATLLGVISDGETIISLRSADGVEIVNDTVNIVHDKAPIYVAYHVLNPAQMASIVRKAGHPLILPQDFEVNIYEASTVKRFAIGSDGITQRRADSTEFVADDDLRGIFDNDPEATAGLQWYLNKRAQRQPFEDDVAIITLT